MIDSKWDKWTIQIACKTLFQDNKTCRRRCKPWFRFLLSPLYSMVESVDLVIFFDTWSETKKSYLDNHMNTNFINNLKGHFGYNHSLYSIPFCSPHTLDLQYSVQQSLCHMQPLPISVPQPYFIRHLEHISQSQWDAFGHIILLCNSTKAWPLWNQ